MLVIDLVKLIGYNQPCLYLAPRGKVILYCTNTRSNKTGIQYELLAIVNEDTGHVLSAWYDSDDLLPGFTLIDWID